MDTKTQCSAASAVLFTPELLEAILLHVDMKTLLLSQRVSRDWASIMASSLVIQQALFMRPVKVVSPIIPFVTTDNHFGDHESKIIYNPLLVAKFGSAFFKRGDDGYYRQTCLPEIYFNTLPWSPRNAAYSRIDAWDKVTDPEDMDLAFVAKEKAIRRSFTRRGASWRQMLVSQPPPPLLGYCWQDLNSAWRTVSTPMVEPSCGGLRMGELYDMVQYHSGYRTHNFSWLPATQKGLGLRFVFDKQEGVHQGRIDETNFAIEFQHVMDSGMYERDPSDVEAFDAEFRCDDFKYIHASSGAISK